MKPYNQKKALFVTIFIAVTVAYATSGCTTASPNISRSTDVVPETANTETSITTSSNIEPSSSSMNHDGTNTSDYIKEDTSCEISQDNDILCVGESDDSEEQSSINEIHNSTYLVSSEIDNSSTVYDVYDTGSTENHTESKVDESNKAEESSKNANVDDSTKTNSDDEFNESDHLDSSIIQTSIVDEDSILDNSDVSTPAIVAYGICRNNCEIVAKNGEIFELNRNNYVSILSMDEDNVVIYWYGSTALVDAKNILIFDEDYEPNFEVGQWVGTITPSKSNETA